VPRQIVLICIGEGPGPGALDRRGVDTSVRGQCHAHHDDTDCEHPHAANIAYLAGASDESIAANSPPFGDSRAVTRTTRRAILGAFVIAFVGGAIYLWRTGAVTPSKVGAWLESLGPAAPALFIGAMIGGAFLGLPGMAFVIGGRLAFGPYLGFAVGYVGGMLAVTLPFLVARRVRGAGQAPWRPKQRHLLRIFEQLETHPFRSVVLLRLLLWFNPPLSYALAFMAMPFGTYAAGCAVALAPVVAVAMLATSWFL